MCRMGERDGDCSIVITLNYKQKGNSGLKNETIQHYKLAAVWFIAIYTQS